MDNLKKTKNKQTQVYNISQGQVIYIYIYIYIQFFSKLEKKVNIWKQIGPQGDLFFKLFVSFRKRKTETHVKEK